MSEEQLVEKLGQQRGEKEKERERSDRRVVARARGWRDRERERYTVEEIPLYDSAEDEPSLMVPKDKSSFRHEFLARGKNDSPVVIGGSAGSEPRLGSHVAVVEPLHSFSAGVANNIVKTEVSEEDKLYFQDTRQTFPPRNVLISRIQSSSACRNYQIGSGAVPKKRSHFANKKSKHNSGKQLDGKHVAQLFTSKKAQEEIMKCEEIKFLASSKLNSSYDDIRPAIEEHERDSQDNVDISAAMTWIGACCSKLKADFDFHFSIVKNVVCPPPAQAPSSAAKPSEEADNETGMKYLTH
ncbi:hypothetical protein RHGRI_016966 [Rhododendron griersonianum]|uniref:Uncharacterized protein n=1 Tax=Rhododendron griersonianum TaxID=479676 RepID=A0AAV6JW18_9ERIC|nr:hypothetical protein RHGRI_016966 [Rhododendron griersonianum]